MEPSDLNRTLHEFAQTDPRAAANAEHASVLAASLADEVGIDPLRSRQAALAAFGVVAPPTDEEALRVARLACDAVLGREIENQWRSIVERVRQRITPVGE